MKPFDSNFRAIACRTAWAPALALGCSLNVPAASEIYSELPLAGQGGAAGTRSDARDAGDASAVDAGGAGTLGRKPEADGGATTRDSARSELGPAVLLLHYTFDDVNGSSIRDSSGNGRFAVSAGNPMPLTEPGHVGRAIHLLGGSSNQYVQLPVHLLQSLRAVSISAWLELTLNTTWDRLFDFNSGEATWFFFSPTGWNAQTSTFGTHLGVRLNANDEGASFFSLTAPIETGAWHHVAVVWAPPLLSYYLDGALMHAVPTSLAPDDLRDTDQNWLGRSSYAADAYFSGLIDEFRVYSGALTEAEIRELSSEGN